MDATEIANLVYRYADYIDSGDLVSAAGLFTHARIKLHDEGELLTHEDVLALWRRVMIIYPDGTPRTRHMVTNPIIEIDRENGKATCRSCYTVTQGTESFPLQVIASGRYHDEFVRVDGRWRFSYRDYSLLDAAGDMSSHLHNRKAGGIDGDRAAPGRSGGTSATRARILAAAQQTFSTVGYSESGIRKIAEMVGLSSTILLRHFGTKAALFEEALVSAMGEPVMPQNRERFGQDVARRLADPSQHISPYAMSVLATGNEEAREIAARVLQEYAIAPMAEWLGPPDAESRARQVLALCAGFVLYNSQLIVSPQDRGTDTRMVEWLARSIQAVVDQA